MLTKDYIVRCALEAGFTLCGVARARVLSEHRARFETALAASGDGALGYLARGVDRRLDPSAVLPGARTVVVCALSYPFRASESAPRVAAYALTDEDYHARIRRMLRRVLERMRGEGSLPIRGKVCCDTAPILEKAWAVEAGLGWQGRNSLLVNPLHGSFMCLGEIVLNVETDSYDEPFAGSGCGECRACIDACPTGALRMAENMSSRPVVPGGCGDEGSRSFFVDTGACISALNNELPRLSGTAPAPVHGWVRGCDECQIACPKNKKFVNQKF